MYIQNRRPPIKENGSSCQYLCLTVSENAPGAHRNIPRYGNTSRADEGSTVHPPSTAPPLQCVTVPGIPAHT